MDDDDLEFTVDPYDLLQEHDLNINRLIKAHNQSHKLLEEMAMQHEQLSQLLSQQANRISKIEHLLETVAKSI
jgi:mevalonate kinase